MSSLQYGNESSDGLFSVLSETFRSTRGPSNAADSLLEFTQRVTSCDAASLYYLDHSSKAFRLFRSVNRTALPSIFRVPDGFDATDPNDETVHSLVASVLSDDDQRIEASVLRNDTGMVGLLVLRNAQLDPSQRDTLTILGGALVTVIGDRFVDHLLQAIQQPIDFTIDQGHFYQQVIDLAALAVDMEKAALREFSEDGQLYCTAVAGFSAAIPRRAFDIDPTEVPIFQEVIDEKAFRSEVSLHDAATDRVGALRDRPELKDVQAFALVPVLIGNDILFGVLSFASRIKTAFTPLDENAFQSVANAVGVSISNYRSFHTGAGKIINLSQIAVAITSQEIAQSARHEAKGIVGNILGQLDLLEQELSSKNTQAVARVNKLREFTKSMSGSLEKIKFATRPPQQVLEEVEISRVWDEAISQLSGRLNTLGISTHFDGSTKIKAELYLDWFRQVFLNLLLNSADAFESHSKKRGREITLQLRLVPGREERIRMRYSDNAGGIDPSSLEFPDEYAEARDPKFAIFQPDVTSKKDGSGWGLFLVRKTLDDHSGSINLISSRGGVTFDIEIPICQPDPAS